MSFYWIKKWCFVWTSLLSPISLDISCPRVGGGGHLNQDPTPPHSKLNIATLMSTQCSCTSAPGPFDSKRPQEEDKSRSARPWLMSERDQKKRDKRPGCVNVQGDAMVYGIEARADSKRNSSEDGAWWDILTGCNKGAETKKDLTCSHSGPPVLQTISHRQGYSFSKSPSINHPQTHTYTQTQNVHSERCFLKKSILLKQNAYLHCRGKYSSVGNVLYLYKIEGNVYKNASQIQTLQDAVLKTSKAGIWTLLNWELAKYRATCFKAQRYLPSKKKSLE